MNKPDWITDKEWNDEWRNYFNPGPNKENKWFKRALVAYFFAVGLWFGLFVVFLVVAYGRDNGQWAQNSPAIRQWFNTLQSKKGGLCCSFADGQSVDDPDWRNTPKGYQVFYRDVWMDVPPDAVVQGANRVGHAVVWPVDGGAQGIFIRCFMPGAEG